MEAKKEFRENLLKKRESFDQYKYLKENESIIKNTQNVIDSLYKRINKNKKNNFSLRNIDIVDTRCALGLYWPLRRARSF